MQEFSTPNHTTPHTPIAPMKAMSSSQRPPSKPRVRNPLTSLKPHYSPSQIEKDFLESGGVAEDDYYSTFPEDVAPLNDSLTSSMVSMYKDLDAPKVKGEEGGVTMF